MQLISETRLRERKPIPHCLTLVAGLPLGMAGFRSPDYVFRMSLYQLSSSFKKEVIVK